MRMRLNVIECLRSNVILKIFVSVCVFLIGPLTSISRQGSNFRGRAM